MTPTDFGVTRSKVKVRGHICCSTFLVFLVFLCFCFSRLAIMTNGTNIKYTTAIYYLVQYQYCVPFSNTTKINDFYLTSLNKWEHAKERFYLQHMSEILQSHLHSQIFYQSLAIRENKSQKKTYDYMYLKLPPTVSIFQTRDQLALSLYLDVL